MVGNERALESIMDLQEFRMRMIMSQYFGPKSDYESFMPIGIMRPHQDSVVTLGKTNYARVLLKISSKLSLMALGCVWNITFHLRNDKSGGRFRKGTLPMQFCHRVPNLLWRYVFIDRWLPFERIVKRGWD